MAIVSIDSAFDDVPHADSVGVSKSIQELLDSAEDVYYDSYAKEDKKKKKKAKDEDDEPKKKKKKAKEEEDEDEEPKKKKKKSKKGDLDGNASFDWLTMCTETVDEISRRQGVDSDLMDVVKAMSTGLLMYDFVTGGIKPAMYTSAGFEQGGKTTGTLALMASAVVQDVPLVAMWDYEGSTANSLSYVANVLRTFGVKTPPKDLFGRKDASTGKWIVPPRVRYVAETRGEKFFDWLAALLREMPDKKFVANKWWLVFDETNKKHKAKVGDIANADMARKYGKGLWVEAPDGKLQGLVLVDSYPAMNPEANDDEEANNALGLHARFFAKHLPRIKGRLAQKMVALVGVNQLREVPMAMYGPKEKEACGQALRFNSDCRNWWNSRASGFPWNGKIDTEFKVEIERSVEFKGKDRYRYVQLVNKKNKLAVPGRKHWVRIWVEDAQGNARGFDPFFDVMCYLKETGQVTGKRKKMFLNLEGYGKAKKPVDWELMKTWVLGTKDEKKEISTSLGYPAMDLRKLCFSQMAKGVGERLYTELRNEGSSGNDDDEDDDE